MEQTAPPEPCASPHTFAQVRGMFDVEGQEPLLVKGLRAPAELPGTARQAATVRIATRGIEACRPA